jgi:hypothetical protein
MVVPSCPACVLFLKPIGCTRSDVACRIGHLVPVLQALTGSIGPSHLQGRTIEVVDRDASCKVTRSVLPEDDVVEQDALQVGACWPEARTRESGVVRCEDGRRGRRALDDAVQAGCRRTDRQTKPLFLPSHPAQCSLLGKSNQAGDICFFFGGGGGFAKPSRHHY